MIVDALHVVALAVKVRVWRDANMAAGSAISTLRPGSAEWRPASSFGRAGPAANRPHVALAWRHLHGNVVLS